MVELKEKRIIETGLTSEEVEERRKQGLINEDTTVPTKKISRILRDNFFTLFNFLNLFLAIAIFSEIGSSVNPKTVSTWPIKPFFVFVTLTKTVLPMQDTSKFSLLISQIGKFLSLNLTAILPS